MAQTPSQVGGRRCCSSVVPSLAAQPLTVPAGRYRGDLFLRGAWGGTVAVAMFFLREGSGAVAAAFFVFFFFAWSRAGQWRGR